MAFSLRRLLPRSLRSEGQVVPVVRLHGTIMAGGGQLRPALNLAAVAGVLEKAFSFRDAPMVAISVNSPGGSPVQSRLIFQRIRDLADDKRKRVVVFVEDVAASGGYMIALAGDEIVADPSSIVGSIGVVSASFGFTGLLEKLGIERRVHTSGENKAVLDPFRPENPEDVERLKALQSEVHQTFIDLVRLRRGDRLDENPDLFTGLFWTGKRGLSLGLVDALGDIRGYVRGRYGPKTKLRLVQPQRSLFSRRLGLFGTDWEAAGAGLMRAADERALWSRYGL